MALFMITLHNKGVLTGGKNTLITAPWITEVVG